MRGSHAEPRQILWRTLLVIGVTIAISCAPRSVPPPASPRTTPPPVVVASPGTGGRCADPVPAAFTCVTGRTLAPSGAAVVGVCVNVGEVTSCPFHTDADGSWRVELTNGVRFIVTFWSSGQERARIDLTPSFLNGGTKAWPTPVVIQP